MFPNDSSVQRCEEAAMSILESLTLGALFVGAIGIVGAAFTLGPHIPELSRRYGKVAVLGVCIACVLAWPLVLAMAVVSSVEARGSSGSKKTAKIDRDIVPRAPAAGLRR
jgi:hypothetical protein